MKATRAERRRQGKAAFELIEEAVHLLRRAPVGAWAVYGLGALPFTLGLLYFIADMSRSAFASSRLAGASLAMALLYLWLKFCHALFAARLRAVAAGNSPRRLTFAHSRKLLLTQAAFQPLAFVALPLSLLLTLPFGWVYAFFQNLTALGDAEAEDSRLLVRKALRQANLWQRQNHVVLLAIFAFGTLVLVNWLTVCLLVPHLFKTLLGIESTFTRSGLSSLNSTLLGVVASLTWLTVAPVLKAVYVLRCYYGQSLQTAEDLRSELLRAAAARGANLAVLLAAVCWLANPAQPRAAEGPAAAAPSSPPAAAVSPSEGQPDPAVLDRQIDRVLAERKYAWRMPREKPAGETDRTGFFAQAMLLLREGVLSALEWIGELLRKLFRSKTGGGGGLSWIAWLQVLLYGLAGLILGLIVYFVYRAIRNRRARAVTTATPIAPLPDVADENVGAEQLPEDGWLGMARDLAEKGELRLAIRALYLGTLAHLARRQLVRLAKFKSNRDYERELRRRGHSAPELLDAFGENVTAFDCAWYGLHEVDARVFSRFQANVDRIRSAGGGAA